MTTLPEPNLRWTDHYVKYGMAVVPDPAKRWRVDLAKASWRRADEPLLEGCPCPACEHGYSRAYLHYLLKAFEIIQRVLAKLIFRGHAKQALFPAWVIDHIGCNFGAGQGIHQEGAHGVTTVIQAQRVRGHSITMSIFGIPKDIYFV